MTTTQPSKFSPQIFTVWSDEIQGRIDPNFYRPELIEIMKKLEKTNYKFLKDVSKNIKNGSTPKGGHFESSGIPYFRSQDFKLFDFKINQFITKDFHEKIKRSSIKSGDVLIAVVGATLGVIGYVPDWVRDANINQNIARIRIKDREINQQYLAIFLTSRHGQEQIHSQATTTTQPYLNNKQLGNIKIPVLSQVIQTKIVAIMQKAYEEKQQKEKQAQKLMDSIDDYVLEELGIKMPAMKHKICFTVQNNEMANKRVDVEYYQPKFKELEKALEDGKYRLGLLKNFITKIHYGASIKNTYVEDGIPLLRILNLKENNINLSNVVKLPEEKIKQIGKAFVKQGDLLISRSGTVGIVAVVPKQADGFAFGSFIIKFCLNDKINKDFVSIWLNNKINKIFTEREKIGAIQGNITINTIKSFKIPVPLLKIQNKIVQQIKSHCAKAEKLQAEAVENLQKAKQRVEKIILG